MKQSIYCDDDKHKPVEDIIKKEVYCSTCGFVFKEETAKLRESLTEDMERASSIDTHYPVIKSNITSLGTQHEFTSFANPGLGFILAQHYGLKDFEQKGCKPVLTPHQGYQVGNSIGRRGYWDGYEFVSSYQCDMWFRKSSLIHSDIARYLKLDISTSDRIESNNRKLYSKLIIDFFPTLVNVLNFMKAPAGRISVENRRKLRDKALEMMGDLGRVLEEEFQKGEEMLAKAEELPDYITASSYKSIAVFANTDSVDEGASEMQEENDFGKI